MIDHDDIMLIETVEKSIQQEVYFYLSFLIVEVVCHQHFLLTNQYIYF